MRTDDTLSSRRNDDLGLKLPFGIEVRAKGRSVIYVILALGVIALLFWHDHKSDISNREMHEALWTQILITSTPEKDRAVMLQRIIGNSAAPESVKNKVDAQ
jgi:hypothetical protein